MFTPQDMWAIIAPELDARILRNGNLMRATAKDSSTPRAEVSYASGKLEEVTELRSILLQVIKNWEDNEDAD